MNKQKTGKPRNKVKQAIAKATADFEKRMFEAKNALELFNVLSDCRKVLNDEVSHWILMFNAEYEKGKDKDDSYLNTISNEVAEIQQLDEKFRTELELIFDDAVKLFRANQNSGKIARDAKALQIIDYDVPQTIADSEE
jgi:hypothetical protein